MISITCTEPPKYKDTTFVGLPFATLFIDLMNNREGQAFFTDPIVNEHLRNIFNAYKAMLDSPKSLQYINSEEPNGWLCPTASKNTRWEDYDVDKSHPNWGFKSFNDFFSRPIRPEARPIDTRSDSIVHSSDSSPLYFRNKSFGSNPATNVQA
jgi:phosphatidylserine decarboxylase